MREIKFRGKTEDGEWVYGDLLKVNTKFKFGENKIFSGSFIIPVDDELDINTLFDGNRISANVRCYQVIPSSVGQFTGLKDVYGNDIYEGDIIEHPDFVEGAYLTIGFHDGYFHGDNWGSERTDFTKSSVEGNVTDNPDLLQ